MVPACFLISENQMFLIINKTGTNMMQTITGMVVPAEWDEADNVIGVSIQGNDEIEYQVAFGLHFDAIRNLCGRRIIASGTIEELRDGARIDVLEYRLAPHA